MRRFFLCLGIALMITGLAASLSCKAPTPTPTPSPTPVSTPFGMKPGERFHEIHSNKLQLKCDFCHTKQVVTYNDPLAQTVNLADKRACLSCHKEGSPQPFYGEEWSKAKVGR